MQTYWDEMLTLNEELSNGWGLEFEVWLWYQTNEKQDRTERDQKWERKVVTIR